MERRGSNSVLIAVLAVAVGFLAAWLIFGNDDSDNSSATVSATSAATTTTQAGTPGTTAPGATTTSTTATTPGAAPGNPQATVGSCVELWNAPLNRGNQTFIVTLMSQQPIRVHVGVTTDVPPECLVTITANNGDAYVFPEGGGGTYPYAQAPGKSDASTLPAAQKTSNALEQGDGTLKAR